MTSALTTWAACALALVGTVANVRKRRWGFGCWLVSNVVLVAHNLATRDWPQAALFSVYVGLAFWGWVSWGKPRGMRPCR